MISQVKEGDEIDELSPQSLYKLRGGEEGIEHRFHYASN